MAPMRLKLLSNKILLKVLIAILLFFTMLPVVYYRQLYHQKKLRHLQLKAVQYPLQLIKLLL